MCVENENIECTGGIPRDRREQWRVPGKGPLRPEDIVSEEELMQACFGINFINTRRISLMMAVSRRACGIHNQKFSKELLRRLKMVDSNGLNKRGKDYLAAILKIEK